MSTYILEIIGNVNQEQIENLISFYLNSSELNNQVVFNETGEVFDKININISPLLLENEIQLELDLVYLGYLVLVLDKYKFLNVQITIINQFIDELVQNYNEEIYTKCTKVSDRAYSIYDQIQYLKNYDELKNRINFKAQYYNKEKRTVYNVTKQLESSKRFFPIIIIRYKEDIEKYFNSNIVSNNIVGKLYYDKCNELVKEFSSVKLSELNIVQIYILRLLLTDDNKDNKSLTQTKVEFYIDYCKQLSYSLKELAINIVEHSQINDFSGNGIGIITGRIFEKNRIINLKGENEKEFLSSFDEKEFFIDVNVFDLGYKSLRGKYIENIDKNIKSDYGKIINCQNDKDIIENIDEFSFEDFYIPNSKTEHQLNKIISRYGIQYFTQLCTKRFDGFIKAISHNEGVVIAGNTQRINAVDKTRYGTSYNCILPINEFNNYFNQTKKKFSKLLGQGTDMYSQLLNFKKPVLIKHIEKVDKYNLILFNDYPTNFNDTKYDYIQKIKNSFLENYTEYKENIILIDSENTLIDNASDWIRLFTELTLEFPNLIVYNIDKEITREIIDIRRLTSNSINTVNFWNKDSCVLFYSYQKENKDDIFFRYGATALTGNNESEYDFVNRNIWKSHYSYYEGFILNQSDSDSPFSLTNLFFSNENLLSFDLLITIKDRFGGELSLFEKSLQYALNKPLEDNLYKDTNNKGYKIKDTHFRLGSKIHIDNFYYAKRVFQNSFFATPLAFILAKSIQKEIDTLISENKIVNYNFTIFGYESYSEFLVSIVRNILSKIYKNKINYNFNHNTINTESKLSRPIESIQENVFIIVPIASTFSTSIKIKNDTREIIERNKKGFNVNFLEPHFNIVLVGETDFENHKDSDNKVIQTSILNSFGWEEIHPAKKIVKIREFAESEAKTVDEKYFIPVYSKWQKAEKCDLCFSEKYIDEKCLIETGNSSITPRLVFGLPKTKPDYSQNSKLDLIGSLLYGNLRKGDNKYLYFTRVGEIINKQVEDRNINLELIKDWLKNKVKEKFEHLIVENKKIVLVTPSTSTKSNFIDLVNELVFNYSANCLTISIGEDYIENSDSLYSDGLYKANIVVFVDDVLSTIQSFVETNKIINYIRKKSKEGRGIDYCISLINRMTFENEDELLLKLTNIQTNKSTDLNKSKDNLIYYCKINNPTITEPNKKFPLSTESLRYEFLSKISSLDGIRSLFYKKHFKLRKHDIVRKNIDSDTKKLIDDEIAFGNKKLFQLLILDKLYSLFEYNNNQYINSSLQNYFEIETPENPLKNFKLLVNDVKDEFYYANNEIKPKHKVHDKVFKRYVNNLDFVVLKIICSTPLIYYKQIRESAFSWVLKYIELSIKGCTENNIIGIYNINEDNLLKYFEVSWDNNYSEFQKLKFLLKRSVQLKSNVIIHNDFFYAIKHLISLIYNNYETIKEKKEENEVELLSIITKLFQTNYEKGHLELYDYVEYLQRSGIISSILSNDILNGKDRSYFEKISKKYIQPNSESLQFEDKNKVIFDKLFTELKFHKKYRITNSKSLIYNLIVLIKELTYEHEPKAIELEDRISNLKDSLNDYQNGTFNHYLRLLQVENTSAINSFYEKEKIKLNTKILNNSEINFINEYNKNPIFISIEKLINQNDIKNPNYTSFNSFLKIKTNIDNWLNDLNENYTIDTQIKLIQELIVELIGKDAVKEVSLSVNYKPNSELSCSNIFFFDAKSDNTKYKNLYDFINEKDISNSLNYKMYEGINEYDFDFPLSNLEIIKDGNDFKYRECTSLENEEVKDSLEFTRINQDCNLLFVRLSDFISNNSNINNPSNLNAIAVFTIYLNSPKRIEEKILRLLLLLRNPLCQFLIKLIKNGSMLAYITSKSTSNYQKHLKHGIGNYLKIQSSLTRDIEQLDDKLEVELNKIKKTPTESRKKLDEIHLNISSVLFKEHYLLNRAISSQIKINDSVSTTKNILFKDYIIEMIKTIYTSKYLTYLDIGSLDYTSEITFIEECDFPEVKVSKELIDSVLFELIFNQKKYGINRKIMWKKDDDYFYIIFSNGKKENSKNNKYGYGTLMCKEISQKTNGEIEILSENNKKDYITTLKLKINNESNSN